MRQVLRRVRKRKRVAAVTIAAVVSLSRTVSPAAAVLGWVNRLPARELYVVTDDPVHFRRARRRTKATVVFLPQPTDEWTLRAFGTRLAASDVVFCADARTPVGPAVLRRFARAVRRGADLALSDVRTSLPVFCRRAPVWWVRQWLNMAVGRRDLDAATLQQPPYALGRRAISALGADAFVLPSRAFLAAVRNGLRVRMVRGMCSRIRGRLKNASAASSAEKAALDDLAGAFGELCAFLGPRCGHGDGGRNRSAASGSISDGEEMSNAVGEHHHPDA